MLFRSKLQGRRENEEPLLQLIEGSRLRNLRIVSESVEPQQLDSGVLEVDPHVEGVHRLAIVSGIGNKRLETLEPIQCCQPDGKFVLRRERVFPITVVVPDMMYSRIHVQIRIGH